MVRIGNRRPSLRTAAARIDRGCSGVPLPLEQLPLLARGLPTEALLGQTLGPFGLRALERLKTTTNRFSVDAELRGDVDLVLARLGREARTTLVARTPCRRPRPTGNRRRDRGRLR